MGKDGTAMLWDVNEGKHLYSLDAGSTINAMTFSPKNYWLCAATDTSIKVWDLENKSVLDELASSNPPKSGIPWCVSSERQRERERERRRRRLDCRTAEEGRGPCA